MKWLEIVFGVVLVVGISPAQEERSSEPDPAVPHGNMRPGRRGGEPLEQGQDSVELRLAELKETAPEKYAELIKLRAEDPARFNLEMRRQMGGPRHFRRANAGDQEGGADRLPPRFERRLMDQLREENPERWDEIQRLNQDDPEEAGQMMRDMVRGFRRKHFGNDEKSYELAEKYRQTDDEDERNALRAQIRDAVAESFDARLKDQEQEIEQMIEHLKEVRKKLETLRAHRQRLCEQRVEQLLAQPPENERAGPEGDRQRRAFQQQGRRQLQHAPKK